MFQLLGFSQRLNAPFGEASYAICESDVVDASDGPSWIPVFGVQKNGLGAMTHTLWWHVVLETPDPVQRDWVNMESYDVI